VKCQVDKAISSVKLRQARRHRTLNQRLILNSTLFQHRVHSGTLADFALPVGDPGISRKEALYIRIPYYIKLLVAKSGVLITLLWIFFNQKGEDGWGSKHPPPHLLNYTPRNEVVCIMFLF
jgi:hypothetical protein